MEEQTKLTYRTLYTKKALSAALIRLLARYDFEHITVSMICARAGITRTTFYKHYEDKYALAEEAISSLVSNVDQLYEEILLSTDLTNEEKSIKFIQYILESILKAKNVILSINSKEGNSLINFYVKKRINSYLSLIINKYKEKNNFPYPANITVSLIEGGLYYVIVEWLNNPNETSLDELTNIIYDILNKSFNKDTIFGKK